MRRFLVFLSLTLTLLFLVGTAAARVHTGTLAGTVLGLNGKPAAKAQVTIEASDGTRPHATHTNSHGRFYFPYLVRGLYDVRAYRGGHWSDWKHNITVYAGRQTDVTLRLTRKKRVIQFPGRSRIGP